MIILAPLLCMAPVANVRSLHRTFVDNIASTVEWSGFITKLNGQLQNFNLLVSQLSSGCFTCNMHASTGYRAAWS